MKKNSKEELMRTIAIEEHFLSPALGRLVEATGAFALDAKRLADLGALRLQDMDVSGIDLQVISHTQFPVAKATLPLVQEANDQLSAAVKAHPDRFAGFAALPIADPQAAARELERAVVSLGFKGALVNGTVDGHFLDDSFFFPVFERAASLNVPIYIHSGFPPAEVSKVYYTGFDPYVNFSLSTTSWGWHSEVGLHALRLVMSGLFDRLPTLQIIIGHMGEMIPFMLERASDWLTPLGKNLKRKMPEYIHDNFYITTSGFFSNPPLLCALQVIGADRIIFAVDYPYSTNVQGRAFLDAMSISPADKAKITHLNAERLLKL